MMGAAKADCSPEALWWLRELVAHETLSGSHSNLALLAQIESFLGPRGFNLRFSHSADGQRANLCATKGDARAGGLLLSGHTDVVPVEGQNWSRPPFVLHDDGNALYGRGACDMKGFLAAVLAVVGRIGDRALSQPLHLAFTCDEEIGCVGVRDLLQDLAAQGIRPTACIVGEPTNMKVVRAHKGRHALRCVVRGQAAHSSMSGTGVNAAEVASRLVADIADQAGQLQSAHRDEGFYVPYSTMATCRIRSGFATNVIPEEADFDFDLRYLPGEDPERVLAPVHRRAALLQAQMQETVPSSQVRIARRTAVPALMHDVGADALVARLLGTGVQLGAHVAYTTEGGLYQAQGIPTIVCGPGDIAQAHTADEFILKSQLAACEAMLERLLLGA